MKLITDRLGTMLLQCTSDSLLLFANALNDELHGLGTVQVWLDQYAIDEFELENLFHRIREAYHTARGQDQAQVQVSVRDLQLLLWTTRDVLHRLLPSEVSTRLGVTVSEAERSADELQHVIFDRRGPESPI